jgi:hypothetical protein
VGLLSEYIGTIRVQIPVPKIYRRNLVIVYIFIWLRFNLRSDLSKDNLNFVFRLGLFEKNHQRQFIKLRGSEDVEFLLKYYIPRVCLQFLSL